MGFLGGSDGKESACNAGDLGLISGWEDPLEEGMAIHSSILCLVKSLSLIVGTFTIRSSSVCVLCCAVLSPLVVSYSLRLHAP